jgi:hypothetical protein
MNFEGLISDATQAILARLASGNCENFEEYCKMSSRYTALLDSVEILRSAIKNSDKSLED